ncbi:conserved Plasmodium protein, unknown function [Plasmodium gallinaceum]|uniref:Glutaredoxin-like protein n=1 Tax=Plasmodium gallinaceum TaxID=5849 RepID=A0A1J1GRU7_PLAGA|nr:conserved Plasmodium protein, unknown function [Plasmodium gallinaceum]CRG95224.1 conserved Plasmodium protein, unknown function [Plasmodium gallinaceum]
MKDMRFLFFSIIVCSVCAFCFRQHKNGFVQNENKKPFNRNRLRPLHVVSTYKELLIKLNRDQSDSYVISLYYSTLCTYCNKVTNFLEKNKNIEIIKNYEKSKLEEVSKTNKPIVVLLKNINKENSYDRSEFYYELKIKGNKFQVPAVEINDCIMFESNDIIKLFEFLLNKIKK